MYKTLTRWPLPTVLTWAAAWLLFRQLLGQGAALHTALGAATALGVALSLLGNSWWRRVLIAGGFPLSLALSLPSLGVAVAIPAWAWLIPLLMLLAVYPLNAWRDAPLFPTPARALDGLPQHAPLTDGAQVLDAGCGLGHGLKALRRAYPKAQLHGLEWSWPLRGLCALRCPWAQVRRADIWRQIGLRMTWSTSSSGPRAWRAPSPKRGQSCAQGLGWSASNLMPKGWNQPHNVASPVAKWYGCTKRR